jgi:DNA-binding NarL/FixJ family response regulator
VGVVSLWREEGAPAFSAAEEKLIADLSAPVAEPFRRAALLRADPAADAPDGPGLLMFDGAGVLESLNNEAEAWLRELQPTAISGTMAGRKLIPTEILTVVARARAIAAGLDHGTARARMQSRNGRWLLIHGFRLRGDSSDDGRTALVIEPAKASEVAPIIVEAYELTPREQQITQLIARGLSTADIARRLTLSPHTVRDYVKQVFEKVGVSTRGELVAKIFAEHYLEPLHRGSDHAAG